MHLVFNKKILLSVFIRRKLKSKNSFIDLKISEKENSGYKNAGYKIACLWRVTPKKKEKWWNRSLLPFCPQRTLIFTIARDRTAFVEV